MLASQGVWTWEELLYKIPWCVVLAAINDQPHYDRKDDETEITSESEAKKFFNV